MLISPRIDPGSTVEAFGHASTLYRHILASLTVTGMLQDDLKPRRYRSSGVVPQPRWSVIKVQSVRAIRRLRSLGELPSRSADDDLEHVQLADASACTTAPYK